MRHSGCVGPVLERLTDGDAEPVFVADFQRMSSAPRFGELLNAAATGHPIYQADPVGYLTGCGDYWPLCDLAVLYADEFLSTESTAAAVTIVGYCSAADLSLRIAELVARSCEVRAILVRPTWPDDAMIGSEFARLRHGLGTVEAEWPDLSGDSASTLRTMEELLSADLRAMIKERDLHEPSVTASGLLDRSVAWLGFLLASRDDARDLERDPKVYQVTELNAPATEEDADRLLAAKVLSLARGKGETAHGAT
jgi:hypothetical protein